MSEIVVRTSYEGQREMIRLYSPNYAQLENTIKKTYRLDDVDLVAKRKDNVEYDIRDDDDLRRHFNANLDKILVFEYQKNPLELILGSERHALNEVPGSDSVLVRYAKTVVIPEFKLPNFVERLSETTKLVRLSFYHLIACGEIEVANNVEEFTGEVLKQLMENSRVTFDLFFMTTRDMLQLTKLMFQYSCDGVDLHDQAVRTGELLGEKAVKIEKEAGKRVEELTAADEKIKNVVHVVSAKNAEKGVMEFMNSERLEEINDKSARLEEDVVDATTRKDAAERELKEARDSYQTLEEEHWEITWFVLGIFRADSHKELMRLRRIRDEAQAKLQAVRKEAADAEREKRELKAKMERQKKSQASMVGILDYLNKASKSIKQARLILQDMLTFWRKMENAGESLAQDKSFLESTKMAVGDDRMARRLRHSMGYKRQAINYIARIVAIRDISIDCSKQLSLVGDDIDAVLGDTPTRTEALAKVDEMSRSTQPRRQTSLYSLEGADQVTVTETADLFTMPVQASG